MKDTAFSIDIETLSLGVNAHILQVGFGARNLRTGDWLIEPMDFWIADYQPGREKSASTVEWWSHQDSAVRAQVHDAPEGVGRVSFAELRNAMAALIPKGTEYGMWANHIAFDLGNLRSAFGGTPPWHYRTEYDLPTVAMMLDPTGALRGLVPNVAAHVASADVRWNLEYLTLLYKRRQDEVNTLWAAAAQAVVMQR